MASKIKILSHDIFLALFSRDILHRSRETLRAAASFHGAKQGATTHNEMQVVVDTMVLNKEQQHTIAEQQHTTSSTEQQVVLDAELQLWNHTFGYVKSMALKAALDLGTAICSHR